MRLLAECVEEVLSAHHGQVFFEAADASVVCPFQTCKHLIAIIHRSLEELFTVSIEQASLWQLRRCCPLLEGTKRPVHHVGGLRADALIKTDGVVVMRFLRLMNSFHLVANCEEGKVHLLSGRVEAPQSRHACSRPAGSPAFVTKGDKVPRAALLA